MNHFHLAIVALALFLTLPPSRAQEADTLIQLFNNPVADVLATYEQLTGRQVLREDNLPDADITINVSEPVTREKAIELIESALLLNGFALVTGPGDSMKVISLLSGKNPRSAGVRVYDRLEAIPPGDQVVSYLLRLDFMTAEEALPVFTQHFAPTQPYGSVVSVPSANALLVTESASAVREMVRLKEQLDIPPPEVEAHFVTLSRANADRVVETIENLLEGGSREGASDGSRQLFAGLSNTAPVEFAADNRTNRVVVVCPPMAFPYYARFVESFDVPAEISPTYEFQLQYVAVAEILPALAKALREGQPSGDKADDPEAVAQEAAQAAADGSGGGSGDATDVLGTVKEKTERNLPVTVTLGNTRLIADQRNNAIIAIAPPESLERIESVIHHLDKPPMQVYLSIVIMELDVTNDLEYGVDFLLQGSEGAIASRQSGTINLGNFLNPANTLSSVSGFSMFGTFGTALDVLVTALERTNRVKILGRPTIYTSNNKKAVISVGEEIPVPRSTVSTVNPNNNNSTALTSTIEYKDVLLQLEVVPLVNSENEVTLEIAQRNDQLGQTFEISGSEVTSVRTQQIKTSVTVPNQHTVVLGGLITEREEKRRSQVPILGDIPVIGLAFSGNNNNLQRKELLLMIQPQIIQGRRDLYNVNALEKARHNGMDARTEEFIAPALPVEDERPPDAELVPFNPSKHDRSLGGRKLR